MVEVFAVDGNIFKSGGQILKSSAVEVVGNILEGCGQILKSSAVEEAGIGGIILDGDGHILESCVVSEAVEVDGHVLEGGGHILKSCAVSKVFGVDGNTLEGGSQILESCAVEVVGIDGNILEGDGHILQSCAVSEAVGINGNILEGGNTILKSYAVSEVVEVDGNILEGGGHIVRSCAAYAAILRKRVHFTNIRANRPKPGLRPAHIEGLKLVSTLTYGELVGAIAGSEDTSYTPGQILCDGADNDSDNNAGSDEFLKVEINIERVGASSLLVQGALPMLLFAPKSVELILKLAGTKVFYEPPIDYMKYVLVPVLCTQFKVNVEMEIVNRGYMPRGGGILNLKVTDPTNSVLRPIRMLDRGALVKIFAKLCGYGRPVHPEFVNHAREAVLKKLHEKGVEDTVSVEFVCEIDGMDTNEELECRLLLYAETSGGCILSGASKGGCESTNPELLASQSVGQLVEQLSHGGCIDEYLQDQLIIYMSLAEGVSEILSGPITSHTETAIHFAHQMTQARIMIKPIPGTSRNLIQCDNHRRLNLQTVN